MLESKIILALTIRDFDFTCEFNGTPAVANPFLMGDEEQETAVECPRQMSVSGRRGRGRWSAWRREGKVVGEDGQWRGRTVEGHEVWQILKGAAKPRAGMPGRMKLREVKGSRVVCKDRVSAGGVNG